MKKMFVFLILILGVALVPACNDKEGGLSEKTINEAYRLVKVWGSSPTDVYAVGAISPNHQNGIILHYDGNMWSKINIGTAQPLYDIWGSSSSDIFVLGENNTLFHYDGNFWSKMSSGAENELYGIWGTSSSDVFAVGDGVILHYDGSSWSAMTIDKPEAILGFDGNSLSELTSGTTKRFFRIWGSSPTDVYVVGFDPTFHTGTSTILHYNGSSWSEMSTDTIIRSPEGLDIPGISSTDPVPGNGTVYIKSLAGLSISGVWCSSSSNVFVVGSKLTESRGIQEGVILHYDGNSWSATVIDTALRINAVWGSSPSDVYAAGTVLGDKVFNGVILHYNGDSWSEFSRAERGINSIWGSSYANVFAVGEEGTILHYTK